MARRTDLPAQQKDLTRGLRKRKTGVLLFSVCILALILITMWGMSRLRQLRSEGDSVRRARQELLATGTHWSESFTSFYDRGAHWLEVRGTSFELNTFNNVAHLLFRSVQDYAGSRESPSVFGRVMTGIHSGGLRASFLILASWRLWLVFLIGAGVWSFYGVRVHAGDDFLGQTGNGRLFYSGILANLRNLNDEGAPDYQVTGLACPAASSIPIARTAPAAKVLEQYDALCDTNLELVAIVEAHDTWPAFAQRKGRKELQSDFSSLRLPTHTASILKVLLELHQFYLRGDSREEVQAHLTRKTPAARGSELPVVQNTASAVTPAEFSHQLQLACNRVLTPFLRNAIAEISPAEIATAVLAYQAGKSLAYAHEAGRWIQKSSFPQLSARAVLHSVPSFGKEFDYYSRMTIRRSLIYGSRSSVFGPVRFPVDLSPECRALRQWIEVLMALPEELQRVADEVELFGIICEAHADWADRFFQSVDRLDQTIVGDSFATETSLLFVPAKSLLSQLRQVIDPARFERLSQLVLQVSQQQTLRDVALEFEEEGQEGEVPDYQRIFPPLSIDERKELAQLHGLSEEELRNWSASRVILNSFGWLGRRVGDYTVPESSIVFAVLDIGAGAPGANEFGFIGARGMVPLRSTNLESRFGRSWGARFVAGITASMAESQPDYEQLLRGVPLEDAGGDAGESTV